MWTQSSKCNNYFLDKMLFNVISFMQYMLYLIFLFIDVLVCMRFSVVKICILLILRLL
jgi:hypothetical protein